MTADPPSHPSPWLIKSQRHERWWYSWYIQPGPCLSWGTIPTIRATGMGPSAVLKICLSRNVYRHEFVKQHYNTKHWLIVWLYCLLYYYDFLVTFPSQFTQSIICISFGTISLYVIICQLFSVLCTALNIFLMEISNATDSQTKPLLSALVHIQFTNGEHKICRS